MKSTTKLSSAFSAFFSLLLLAVGTCLGQGVIGGSQNGLGPGGYLPQPSGGVTLGTGLPGGNPSGAGITASLTMPGYHFLLLDMAWKNSVGVSVDGQAPVTYPLPNPKSATPGTGPGFFATFELANHSHFGRIFEFVDHYYANIKIIFRVFDSKGQEVWQSYLTEVDIPPFAQKVDLTLAANSTWRKTVFVPFLNADSTFRYFGNYTLQAEVIGTPEYSASAPFNVSLIIVDPLVPIVPLPSGISGVARVGPIRPVEILGQPNTAPLPGAVIRINGPLIVPPFPGAGTIAVPSRTVVADRHGRFQVLLPPGRYQVIGEKKDPTSPYPVGSTQEVTVRAHQITSITVNYDSGIR